MIKKILGIFQNTKAKEIQSSKLTQKRTRKKIESTRIGEIGEYKLNIQLDQLPKECKYLSDIMIKNPKSKTGFSQIDHVVISPYGLFVIETKNYDGTIKGKKEDTYWTVNNRFKMYNPLRQNYGHIKALEALLSGYPTLTFISLISFTMRSRFSIDPTLRKIDSNELIVYDVELSEFIDRKILRMKVNNQPMLQPAEILKIYKDIKKANISDPVLRAEHENRIKKS